ncbi:MAG: threonylcarbamoyl-AMP synthase [Candidatus Marinimicrobia bacterium]|nr:threonylcarbamoyl-AMP synthase [Candidatus Neomarinimicrobiota bacterium]
MTQTKIIKINDKDSMEHAIIEASVILAEGGIIAYPTDTLYGLGVDADDRDAMQNLQDVKERTGDKSISIMLSGIEMLYNIFTDLSKGEKNLIDEFLPGELTIVLKRPANSKFISGDTVGIRIPRNEFCNELVEQYGKPITTTSVNLSGGIPARNADEVMNYFSGKIHLLIDGGKSPNSGGSTVVQTNGDDIKILRQGKIIADDIFDKFYGKLKNV